MLPAPLPNLDELDPETLKALLIAKHNESIEQHKQLRSNSHEIEHLKLVIEKYRRMIFGRKSEKLARELEQLGLRLEELETTQAADQAAEAQQPSSPQSSYFTTQFAQRVNQLQRLVQSAGPMPTLAC